VRWGHALVASFLVTGVLWGAAGLLAWPDELAAQIGLLATIALAIGALCGSTSGFAPAAYALAAGQLGVLAPTLLVRGEPVYAWAALFLVCYAAVLLVVSRHVASLLARSIVFRLDLAAARDAAQAA